MIELKNIGKCYGDLVVLENINAVINKGDIISIIGPSGSGKSTLLNTINVLDRATTGQILYDGVNIMDSSCDLNEYRKKMGMVFQSFNLFGHMTVIENVMVPQMDLLGRSKQEAYDNAVEYLKLVGMLDRMFHYPAELSGGQKQRTAIARTLAMDPEVLLLDEPTSALDPTMVGEVEYVIKKLAKAGRTMVIVTHQMRFAREISNRVFYMDEKGIYEDASPSQIFNNPQKEKTRQFINKLKCLEIKLYPSGNDIVEAVSHIENYGHKLLFDIRRIRRAQLLFEEFCVQGILKHATATNAPAPEAVAPNALAQNAATKIAVAATEAAPDAATKIAAAASEAAPDAAAPSDNDGSACIRVVFEFDEKADKLSMYVFHNGESGMNYLDDYSKQLVENIGKDIEIIEKPLS